MSIRTRSLVSPLALAALLAAGCATETQVKELEERVAALEKKVEEQGSRPSSAAAAAAAQVEADPEKEKAAQELYTKLTDLTKEGKMAEAKVVYDELNTKFGDTLTARRAAKQGAELTVIGKDAPSDLSIDKWFQGEGNVDLTADGPTLLVFFEEWCPHCKREVPKLQETYGKFHDKGLNMVGITKVTRSATDEKVAEFVKTGGLTYPVAKETGELSTYFAVSGIPAAAVIKDGKIIWRGHPARLTDEMLEGWL